MEIADSIQSFTQCPVMLYALSLYIIECSNLFDLILDRNICAYVNTVFTYMYYYMHIGAFFQSLTQINIY